jgi:hypothetical protein
LIRVASCPRNEVEIRQTTGRCAETQVFDVVMEKGKEEEVISEIADYEIFFSPLGLGGTEGKEEGVCCQGGGQVRSCGKWKVARAGEDGRRNAMSGGRL